MKGEWIMIFNVNESLLINQLMETPDKSDFLNILAEVEENTEEKELIADIHSLYEKIDGLNSDTVKQIYKDRIQHKISIYPAYEI